MHNAIKFGIAGATIIAVALTSMPYFGFSGSGCNYRSSGESDELRVGYFPNINHAQAVIGLGRGDFQQALDGIKVTPKVLNAGPQAIEALNAGAIDVAYVGPNPAINGYVQSKGCDPKIISGAASGGAVFVVRNDAGIDSVGDFANKKFASPQLGNTQDVALRKYLLENGYETGAGGNVEVLPIKNPDIITQMEKKDIDGAWVPEPWGTKLVKEANARIFLDERELWPPNGNFVTAHIIVRSDYLQNNPETVRKLLEVHVDETGWINENPDEAMQVFNAELEKLTRKTIPEDEFREGFSRITLTWDPLKESLFQSANDAHEIGFFAERPDLSDIYDLTLLNEVLTEKGLPPIQ
jgi:NitT/TauT family transport system substrate-binding protein